MIRLPSAVAGLAALAGLATAPAALAQAPAADAVVKAFSDYAHPDIGPDACKTLNATTAECTIPGGVAGRYFVEADGSSTATDAKAAQSMTIRGDTWLCAQAATKPEAAKPWSSGPRTLKVGCMLNVLADSPVVFRAIYADSHATKNPKGPVVTIKRVAWDGVISAQAAGAGVQ